MDFIPGFIAAFTIVFAIIDPFASVPMFLTLTKSFSDKEREGSADTAIIVAGILAVGFLIFGNALLSAFGITLSSFKIFGGIVLGFLAVETVLGVKFGNQSTKKDLNVASVIIATPMLTGPGVITTVIVLASLYGIPVTLAATICSLALSWVVLRNSGRLAKLVGTNNIEIASKVMGLILGALGVQFILTGLAAH